MERLHFFIMFFIESFFLVFILVVFLTFFCFLLEILFKIEENAIECLFSSTNYKKTILSGGKACFFSISTAKFRILHNAFCEKCLYLGHEQESFPFVWL